MSNSVFKNFEGQVAIVTGAANGMGKTIAQSLAEAGVKVTVCDIDKQKTLELAQSINGLGVEVDVTRENDVEQMVSKTVDAFGTVDILINNAGVLRPTRIGDIEKKEWDFVLDVNLNGTFLCTKAVLGLMKENKYGRIINMSSSAGRSVSTLGGAHYTAAKAGVLGLTRAVAKEVGKDGITANAICPGLIDTDMVRSDCTAEQIQNYENSFPVPRLGYPSEVADVVFFLIRNSYMNGASIDINGGDLMI